MIYLGARNHLQHQTPATTHHFKWLNRRYKVIERVLSDGSRMFSPKVYLERETRNVFGDRSTQVFQCVWRSLPDGHKRRELQREAELISLRQRVSPPQE